MFANEKLSSKDDIELILTMPIVSHSIIKVFKKKKDYFYLLIVKYMCKGCDKLNYMQNCCEFG